MTRRATVLATTAALVAVAVAVAAVVLVRQRDAERSRDDAARAAATALAQAWTAGDLSTARFTTSSAAAAQARYAAVVAGLDGARPTVAVTAVQRTGATATAGLDVTWPGVAGWHYTTTASLAPLVAGDDEGAASWGAALTPALLAPGLADGEVLRQVRTQPPRAAVLARDGSPLVVDTPVVQVGVQPSRTTDPDALAKQVAALTGVDAAGLATRIRAATASDALVPVITLREGDYAAVRSRLQPLPGTVFTRAVLPLAPTSTFARPLLGTVGAATADAVSAGGGRVLAGDTTGLGGLQQRYDQRLAGTPGTSVEAVAAPAAGAAASTQTGRALFTAQPTAGKALRLSLDARVQRAAEAALAGATSKDAVPAAALVAVDVPTGDLLAVADAPSYGSERALTGQYPPGSTFKVVTTTALLGDGLTPDTVVPCTPTTTVDGRSFRNFEGEAFGAVPFRTDFAQSCNTAFISASSRLAADDLQRAAASLGVGGDWDLGTPSMNGTVPADAEPVDRAAAAIGQGTVLASPVAMAVAAATVARGSWTAPRLVLDPAPPAPAGAAPAPDAQRLGVVRDLMRSVVTSGTAKALADVPGAPVIAKTGTAEYGSADPPQVHAWVVGAQGDVAFAVLVEDGSSGATTAVPVAEAFLRALA